MEKKDYNDEIYHRKQKHKRKEDSSTRDNYESSEEESTPYSSHYPTTSHQETSYNESRDLSPFDLLLGNEEERKIVASKIKEEGSTLIEKAKSFYKNDLGSPGFFTPFNSKKEFGIVAASPVVLPVAFGLVTAVAAIAAVGSALTSLGSLVFAAGYGLDGLRKDKPGSKEQSHAKLRTAAEAGIVAAVATLAAVAAFIVTAVIAPVALVYLLSRSGASLLDKASACVSSCRSKHEDDFVPDYSELRIN